MVSNILFVSLTVVVCILLLISVITSIIAAINTFNSIYFVNNNLGTAHKMFTISAILGSSVLIILIIAMIMVITMFKTVEISDMVLQSENPTKFELLQVYRGEKELSSFGIVQLLILITLIILCIVTFIVGILSIIGTIQIGGMPQKDEHASTAYISGIISSISAIGGIGMIIACTVIYAGIKNSRDKQLKDIEDFEKRIETDYGLLPSEVML